MINAGSAAAYLTLDRSSYTAGLKSAYQELSGFLDNSKKAGDRIQYLGGVIESSGNAMIKGATVPLVAAGTMLTKFSMDYESSVAKVASIADTSAVSINSLSSGILNLSKDTGISASKLNNTLYDVISAGIDTASSVEFLADATKLAKAGFAETGDSVSVLTTILNSYGLAATETTRISDILVQTQNLGVTTVAELSQSMGRAIPIFSSAGLSIESLSASYVQMTKNGIGTAEATTRVSALVTELSKSGTKVDGVLKEIAGGSFRDLTANGKTLGDVMNMLDQYAKSNSLSLGDLFGSSEAATAAMILAKNEGNDFNNTLNQLSNSAGSTDKAFKTVTDTTQERFTKALNKLKVSAIDLGNNLLPLANDMIEGFTGVVDKFNNLDEATQKNIVSAGMYVAAAGPVLSITGKLVTGVGKLVSGFNLLSSGIGGLGLSGLASGLGAVAIPLAAVGAGFYVWHESMDVANQSVTKSREEMSWMERVIADMTGKVTYSRKELESMGLVYADFNKNISKEFQESVKNMTTDIHEFGMSLGQISLDKVITEEEHNQFVSKVDSVLQSAIQAIETKSAEMQSGLRSAFSVDGVIDENESSLLEWWASRGSKEKEEAQNLRDEIAQIESNAFAEGRALTGEEIAAIEERYAQIKQIELEAQASNSYELEYAHQEFQVRMRTLDTEEAEKLLQQRAQQRDEEQIQIRTNYDTLIALAKQGYDDMSEEDKKYSNETVARLKEAKQKELDISNSYYDQDYQYAIEHNENLKTAINKFSGEILKQKDIEYYEQLVQATEHYADINRVTESGYKKLFNTATGTYDDVYVKIDEITEKLSGVYDLNTQSIGSMTRNDAELLQNEIAAWSQTSEGILSNCLIIGDAYIDTQGNITNSSNEIIGKLGEVVDANGKVVDAVLDVNGNPIRIGDNTDEVIRKLKNTREEVKSTDGKKANIEVTDNGTANQVKNRINDIPTYKQVVVGVVDGKYNGSTMYATGTESAMSGLASVAEYGPELIQSNGTLMLATNRQLMNFSGGEAVYNTRETEDILREMNSDGSKQDIIVDSVNEVIIRLSKVVNVLNDVLNTEGILEVTSNINLDKYKLGEVITPIVSNKLAVATMKRR